jgi:hypothetical protein
MLASVRYGRAAFVGVAGERVAEVDNRDFHRTGYLQHRWSRSRRSGRPGIRCTYGGPFRTQHPLGVVVNRPSVWPDR